LIPLRVKKILVLWHYPVYIEVGETTDKAGENRGIHYIYGEEILKYAIETEGGTNG